MKLKIVMNKHKSNKIKENSNTVRHLIMGQITTTQNLVAIKEVRHAGQWVNSLSPWIFDKNLENITCILMQFSPSNSLQIFIESALHGLMKTFSRHWLRLWLAAWRHQAVTWANVDQDPCRHMTSLGHNELMLLKFWTLGFGRLPWKEFIALYRRLWCMLQKNVVGVCSLEASCTLPFVPL